MKKPELEVLLFSDFSCPFCYIGDRRLARLSERFALKVDRRYLEIHPDTPPEGMPLSELGYPPDRWRRMMDHLSGMAAEEKILLAEREFTTNSRRALLLAEAAKEEGEAVFHALNERIFAAFFSEGRNIGDEAVLRSVADEAGVSPETVWRAWNDPSCGKALRANRAAAARLGITGVPTYLIGNKILVGAVPAETLLEAANEAVASTP